MITGLKPGVNESAPRHCRWPRLLHLAPLALKHRVAGPRTSRDLPAPLSHHVFLIGCASVLKITRLKFKVAGGEKSR